MTRGFAQCALDGPGAESPVAADSAHRHNPRQVDPAWSAPQYDRLWE